jgi:hypothetical protein
MVVEVAAVTGEWSSEVGEAHELANATLSPSSSAAAAARCVLIVVLRASWTRGVGGALVVVEEVSFILGFKAFWAGPN